MAHTVTVKGAAYSILRIDARQQFHIVRRVTPALTLILPAFAAMKAGSNGEEPNLAALEPIGRALAALSDADADHVLFGLLSAARKVMPQGLGVSPVVAGDASAWTMQDAEADMSTMLIIAWEVLRFNLGGFFDALPPTLKDKIQTRAV